MLSFDTTMDLSRDRSSLLVNTTNTKGRMGKGVALLMKHRFPEIMPAYVAACENGRHAPGTIQLIPTKSGQTVLNMATKNEIYEPSQYDWVGSGLVYLNRILCERAETYPTVAMPVPGCGNGGLDEQTVVRMAKILLRPAADHVDIRLRTACDGALDIPFHYAGVGSRETPDAVLPLMAETAALLAQRSAVLRSGGAIGADTAFYNGAREAAGGMEIFLPKPRNGVDSAIFHLSPVHKRMALAFHPKRSAIEPDPGNPNDKRHSYLALMARNGNQVFGVDFTKPSDLILCWTVGGKGQGGTGQAIRLARSAGIPVIDLGQPHLQGIRAETLADMAIDLMEIHRARCEIPAPRPEVMDCAP